MKKQLKKEWLKEIENIKIHKEEGLYEWIEQLKKDWDKLTEEAQKILGYEKNKYDYIVFRMALLLFALKRIPPSTHWAYRDFKKQMKYYI